MNKKGTRARTREYNNHLVSCRRSVSPVIATVLLIAIVIVIALIIFFWILSFVQEAKMKNGKSAEQNCQEINLEATLSQTSLSLKNNGNIPIRSLNIVKTSQGSINVENLTDINLLPGDSNDFEIGDPAEKTEIVPIILVEVKNSREQYLCENSKKEVFSE